MRLSEEMLAQLKDEHPTAYEELMSTREQLQTARAAIESAPHAKMCAIFSDYDCNCWKKQALDSISKGE